MLCFLSIGNLYVYNVNIIIVYREHNYYSIAICSYHTDCMYYQHINTI